MPNIRLRLLSYFVIAYLLLALAWWSVLLYNKNNDALQAKTELLAMGMAAEGLIHSKEELKTTQAYRELQQKYKRQEWMIMGESLVFIISLVIGIWLIQRSYNKEIESALQRRNFLLSITHELKSPIASIRLVLETLLKRTLPKEKIDQLSTSGLKETERLHLLVNNLLFAAKVETAYQPLFEDINLQDLIRLIIAESKTKYPQASIILEENADLPQFKGDKMGLQSMTLNLIENAIKYSPEKASITVTLNRQDGHITLQVADEGIGIPNEEKPHIFQKFYRIGNEDTRLTKGTGLGLYIVKEIVKAHNGKITVEDNHPRGTIFKIKLPLK